MGWLVAASGCGLALAISARLAGSIWPFELITHFTPHLALLALGLLAVSLWFSAWASAAVSLAALGLAISGLSAIRTAPISSSDRPGLTVVWANVWKRELAADQTLAFAKTLGADVAIFSESPYDDATLPGVGGSDYPYTYDLGRDVAGLRSKIVVLSRRPLLKPRALIPPDNAQRPMVEFDVEIGGAVVRIGALHAFVPASRRRLAQRDHNIAFAAARVRGKYLLVGDFNATMWTPAMYGNGLRRVGHPLLESTWITAWPLVGLAIDHAFPGDGLRVSRYDVGPFLGSDHRAILVRVHPE